MAANRGTAFYELTSSPQLAELCRRYGRTRFPILILGPPGIGKTTLARRIHALSERPGALVNCSMVGIPPNLEHSYLAGHVRGAFTGAHTDKTGPIEAAHRGTLFLDELGLASHPVQEILLQLLDEGTLQRVGEVRARPVDTRLVAATNADLHQMVRDGSFRADLLGRFGYFIIRLSPLRARRGEILPLFRSLLAEERRTMGVLAEPTWTAELGECLRTAPWPDNIRQIRALCRYLLVHWDGQSTMGVADLPPEFIEEAGLDPAHGTQTSAERAREVLMRVGGNKTKAAEALGVSRSHLYRLLAG